jgi:hypothetical protein
VRGTNWDRTQILANADLEVGPGGQVVLLLGSVADAEKGPLTVHVATVRNHQIFPAGD